LYEAASGLGFSGGEGNLTIQTKLALVTEQVLFIIV
jgi:hypothetical protein